MVTSLCVSVGGLGGTLDTPRGTSSTQSGLSTDLSTNVEISEHGVALSGRTLSKNSSFVGFMALYDCRDGEY